MKKSFKYRVYPTKSQETKLLSHLELCRQLYNAQITKSLKILEVESTSKGKHFCSYWNKSCLEMSKRLWLPTKIDWQDSDLILSNGSVFGPKQGSWFSIKHLKNRLQVSSKIWSASLPSSPAEFKECVDISRKIRVFPTNKQKQVLKQWFGSQRFVFNKSVNYLKQPGTKANWKAIKTDIIHDLPEWSKSIPYQIKSIAVRDSCKAISNAKKSYKRTGKISKIKYRNRYGSQNIFIPKTAISKNGIYYTILGQLKLAEKLPDTIRDSRLVYELGQYFLCVSSQVKREILPKPEGLVSLDPGLRTFLSCYSPNKVIDIGQDSYSRIFRLCQHLDNLISRVAKKSLNRRKMLKAANRIRVRIHNLIGELHHQSAAYLTKTFSHIAIPDFDFHSVAAKKKLAHKSIRGLATLAHGKFRAVLKHHCNKRGVVLGTGSEAYTSKTDPFSGAQKDIGSAKTVKLSTGKRYLRDNVGALGIFLRALSDTTWDWNQSLQKLGHPSLSEF